MGDPLIGADQLAERLALTGIGRCEPDRFARNARKGGSGQQLPFFDPGGKRRQRGFALAENDTIGPVEADLRHCRERQIFLMAALVFGRDHEDDAVAIAGNDRLGDRAPGNQLRGPRRDIGKRQSMRRLRLRRSLPAGRCRR